MHGSAEAMSASFRSFTVGLIVSVILLYLVLVAQFRSFLDPFIILLALAAGNQGSVAHPRAYWHHDERHVTDGCCNAGRYRDVKQHPHRGVRSSPHQRGMAVGEAIIEPAGFA